MQCDQRLTAWFNGPKAENGEWFERVLGRIISDYHAWRRNYYPEDGVVLDSQQRRLNEPFQDAFEDKLIELLGNLKADFPFSSPRYAAHMIAEQTLPSIAGYFAAMLYNPNNVTGEAAPVTVRLELEASQMIARMLGYGAGSWGHLCSGGTVATLEALWVARAVKYLPLVVQDVRRTLKLEPESWGMLPYELLKASPTSALESFQRCFGDAESKGVPLRTVIEAYRRSQWNVAEHGWAKVAAHLGSEPVVFAPETAHYCFSKALDVLGIGRQALQLVPVDSDFRMRTDILEERLADVEQEGGHALAVVAVIGSTEEGAVDPLEEILELRSRRENAGLASFWLHADGAYGGYLRTITLPTRLGLGEPVAEVQIGNETTTIRLDLPQRSACDALERLGECDSITIDPHKLGYIPYPAGAICFKSDLVKPILRQEAAYIEEPPGTVEAEQRSDGIGMYILEGSKPGAAAAAVWLSHKLIPLDNSGHGILIRNSVRNACELHALLTSFPELVPDQTAKAECLCAPGSNIVCFAFRPAAGAASLADINALNRAIYARFNVSEGRRVYDQPFFLSRTVLSPRQYSESTVSDFLSRLGVSLEEYRSGEVFLLRSVLMNPWYSASKERGRYFVSALAEALYKAAAEECLNREVTRSGGETSLEKS